MKPKNKKPLTTETQRHRENHERGFGFLGSSVPLRFVQATKTRKQLTTERHNHEIGFDFLCVSVSLWLMVLGFSFI
jgi:hypothetical protein